MMLRRTCHQESGCLLQALVRVRAFRALEVATQTSEGIAYVNKCAGECRNGSLSLGLDDVYNTYGRGPLSHAHDMLKVLKRSKTPGDWGDRQHLCI